ncbi:MAG: 30S ribosomal protein S6 [Bacteroidales bacterium]|nr:30S ribosomal protein S6 [Bacteroidales bacterium]
MKQYETVFIATPVLSDSQIKEAVSKYRDFITDNQGEIVHEEDWGLRKLAYPIEKKSTGFYHLFEFKSEPTLVAKLELQYRRDERIIRFLTFSMDKHSIEYAARRRNKSEKQE